VHYKASKPAYARQISTPITVPPVPAPPPSPQLPSTPTSSGVQEINPDTEVNEAPSISPETLGSTSNSEVARNIPQQQSQVSGQTEAAVKTPSLKRKQQRQEGIHYHIPFSYSTRSLSISSSTLRFTLALH